MSDRPQQVASFPVRQQRRGIGSVTRKVNLVLLIVLVTTVIIFLTEITSNTATAAAFLPLLGPVAVSLDTSAAMLVIPAVVARMLTDSFARMLVLSTGLGAVCGLVGMYLSFFAGVPSGTMIVLTGASVFLVVLVAGFNFFIGMFNFIPLLPLDGGHIARGPVLLRLSDSCVEHTQ